MITVFLCAACLAALPPESAAQLSAATPRRLSALQPTPRKGDPVIPLPRIGARTSEHGSPGFFVKDTGAFFRPRGFNHTVLEHGGTGWHATFNVGTYDADAMETLLAEMARLGANTIRVWAWGVQKASGFTGAPASRGLNGSYMENFVDFLRRATAHHMYVIPIFDETPQNALYCSVAECIGFGVNDAAITGHSRQYLAKGLIAAKGQAAADFVEYVKQANPGLLNTVLGWSLANEVCVLTTEGPFRDKSGKIIPANGVNYDMADKTQRQACYDEGILFWAGEIAAAIRQVDSEALVTAGMWTSDAHGRPPVHGLWPDEKDPRIPPRPSVLGGPRSPLDFIDVHVYPWDGSATLRRDAHERDGVVKPAIVGEYGVFKRNSIDEARVMLRKMLEQAYAMGYQGDLHWVWDLTRVPGQTWSSVEEGLAAYLMNLRPWENDPPQDPP